jgi:AAA domain
VKQAGTRQLPGRDGGQDGQAERVLDAKTVLVVDEAGMLGSRKMVRLLGYAADASAKVVLVGDDKQLASIEAGGGSGGCGCGWRRHADPQPPAGRAVGTRRARTLARG